jgi:hypothetical protein
VRIAQMASLRALDPIQLEAIAPDGSQPQKHVEHTRVVLASANGRPGGAHDSPDYFVSKTQLVPGLSHSSLIMSRCARKR